MSTEVSLENSHTQHQAASNGFVNVLRVHRWLLICCLRPRQPPVKQSAVHLIPNVSQYLYFLTLISSSHYLLAFPKCQLQLALLFVSNTVNEMSNASLCLHYYGDCNYNFIQILMDWYIFIITIFWKLWKLLVFFFHPDTYRGELNLVFFYTVGHFSFFTKWLIFTFMALWLGNIVYIILLIRTLLRLSL